jgi:regulation of enolase protein 1 (concanavalin A-like superfamily)
VSVKSGLDQNIALAEKGIIVNTTVEWKTPKSSPNLMSNNHYTPLWHFHGSTYFVWVNDANRPFVTKIANGSAQTVPLDDNPDYTASPDKHNLYSMGIDKNGLIHIAGDMHNYTTTTSSAGYPPRYQFQGMMYWKSNKPEDVSSGFAFVGGKDAPTTMPGTGYSYGRFFTDNNGELFYSARVKAILGQRLAGETGLGAYKYNPDTSKWSALGDVADNIRPGVYYKVLLWDIGGISPTPWYQGLLSTLKFDNNNRLHLSATFNDNPTLTGNNRLVYAFSNDGGITWSKTNGNRIPKLPIRTATGLPSQGDIVNTTAAAPFFDSKTKVISDINGKPAVINDRQWYTWESLGGWTKKNNFSLANTADLDPNGHLIMTASDSSRVIFADSLDSRPQAYDFIGYTFYESLNEYALRESGTLYGVGVNATDNTQSILKTTITPAPLPAGWDSQDISATPLTYDSTSGFKDGKFVVNNYGDSLDNPNDSFHFIYRKIKGDGFITAYVQSTASSLNARAGVMMRASLAYNSPDVMSSLLPGKNGAIFGFRSQIGGQTTNFITDNIQGPYYVKLEKEGNNFIGYISKDGKTWIENRRMTLSMPDTLYVGLATASYNKNSMQTTIFDKVSMTVGLKNKTQ